MADKYLKIASITLVPYEEDEEKGMPTFLVTGTYLPRSEPFTRKVSMELDGRDVEEEHVSGFDLDDLNYEDLEDVRIDVSDELYTEIASTEAYKTEHTAYLGS